jgi:hypothetical protein
LKAPIDTLLRDLADAFRESGLRHVLIGGHAVNVWAEPRFTADIAFTVVAEAESLARFEAALAGRGWTRERVHGAALPSGPDFLRLTHETYPLPVELQAAKTAYQLELIARALPHETYAGIHVATAEDLLVLKLIAFRAKDQIDLVALAGRPGIDWAYVERWAKVWAVEERLERVRALVAGG